MGDFVLKRALQRAGRTYGSARLAAGRELFGRRVVNRTFAIVSNNCFGAEIYKDAGRQYNTPFVGLFLYPECFNCFLSDFRSNTKRDLEFISKSKYEAANDFRSSQYLYPIARVADSEVHFLHYDSEAEAMAKWRRRADRLPTDDAELFFVAVAGPRWSDDDVQRFAALPLRHKLCLTAGRRIDPVIPTLFLAVEDAVAAYGRSHRSFDFARWLTAGDGTPSGPASSMRHLLTR